MNERIVMDELMQGRVKAKANEIHYLLGALTTDAMSGHQYLAENRLDVFEVKFCEIMEIVDKLKAILAGQD